MTYRRALITGATSGIGAAFAETLPRETALLLTGRDRGRLESTRRRLITAGRRVDVLAGDLALPAARTALIAAASDPPIDLLICNAGAAIAGSFLELPLDEARRMVEVNALGTLDLLHELLPGMIARAGRERRRCGAIVVASMGAFSPSPGLACYGASKSFQLHFVQSLAQELREAPIDLLLLCPTVTDTPFFARAGVPTPARAVPAAMAAREGIAALGRRSIHLCGRRPRPQLLRLMIAQNLAWLAWRTRDARRPRSPGRAAPFALRREQHKGPAATG